MASKGADLYRSISPDDAHIKTCYTLGIASRHSTKTILLPKLPGLCRSRRVSLSGIGCEMEASRLVPKPAQDIDTDRKEVIITQETIYRVPTPASIALLGDLHNHPWQEILHSIERNRPDLIAIAGDVIRGHFPRDPHRLIVQEQEQVLPFLRACASAAPTFFSPGNHERVLCEEDLEQLRGTGVVILDNTWTLWNDIAIGGLTSGFVQDSRKYRASLPAQERAVRYPRRPLASRHTWFRHDPLQYAPDTAWLDAFEQLSCPKILLSHHPEYWPVLLEQRRVDLVLSAHCHGGQIRIAGHGVWAPGQGFLPRLTSGVHEGRFGRLVITRGLSNTAPFPRINNPEEIVYLVPSQW